MKVELVLFRGINNKRPDFGAFVYFFSKYYFLAGAFHGTNFDG